MVRSHATQVEEQAYKLVGVRATDQPSHPQHGTALEKYTLPSR